jgi:hypothetical protein
VRISSWAASHDGAQLAVVRELARRGDNQTVSS